ncbi:MAG: CopD family protein [Anaerolineaceae bacterium]|nr:CopD family protein [Anaerolineaceae bacterium]
MKKARLALLTIWLGLLFSLTLTTSAHGYIVRSIPQDRATLERPPTRLQYWFSEALEPNYSSLNLRDESGTIIASGQVDPDDNTLLSLQIPSGTIGDGSYIVELRPAFASDGHVVVESRVFFVGDAAADLQSSEASDLPIPLEIIWKTLLDAAMFLLFGTFALYAYVLVPAWGSKEFRVGNLPPRVLGRLNRLLVAGYLLAIAASILALVQQTMVFFNVDASRAVFDGLWQVVRIGSRFGDVWNARIFFLVVSGGLMILSRVYRDTAPSLTRAMWTGNTYLVALMLGAQAINSHAAGSLIVPWLGIAMHWLHTVAVAFWIGGILALVAILPTALAPYNSEQRQGALVAVMRRFSRAVTGAVVIVVATGIYNSSNWFLSGDTITSSYGVALFIKLLMVALLLFIGLLHHLALRPQLLDRFAFLRQPAQWASRFMGSLRIEALVVIFAVVTAAGLSATPTPQPEFLKQQAETPRASRQVDDLTVSMTVAPGGPGVNTYDIVLERNDEPVQNARIEMVTSSPSRDIRSTADEADPLDAGLYVSANDTIDEPGVWWSTLDIRLEDGSRYRAAFEWNISADAAVIQSRPPTPLTIASILMVIAAIAYIAIPPITSYAQRNMDFSAQNVLIAIGVIVITIVAMMIGTLFIIQQQEQIAELRNPLPEHVNTVLPDAASLDRGLAIYQVDCRDWVSATDFPTLLQQVNAFRDDELYNITVSGWRNVPACNPALTENERWDVVNYLRTLQPRR